MLCTTFLSTLIFLSTLTPIHAAAIPIDDTVSSPIISRRSSVDDVADPTDNVATAIDAGRPLAQARRNAAVGPWSTRSTSESDDDSTGSAVVGSDTGLRLMQSLRHAVQFRDAWRQRWVNGRNVGADEEEGEEVQSARRAYAVISGGVYVRSDTDVIPLLSLENQTLDQCGAACSANSECNQFELSISAQCDLFSSVVTGSQQAETDVQSAYLGTCSAAHIIYDFPLASCQDVVL